MPSARIVEPVFVFEQGDFRVPPCFPSMAPDQLGLQRLEECLNGGIVVTVLSDGFEPVSTGSAGLSLCRAELTPFCEGGGAVSLEDGACGEVAISVEVVGNGGVD